MYRFQDKHTLPAGTFRFGDPGILLRRRSLKMIGSEPDMFSSLSLSLSLDARTCAHAQKPEQVARPLPTIDTGTCQ